MAAKLIEAAGALQMAVRAAEVRTYILFGYLRSLETAYGRTCIVYICVCVRKMVDCDIQCEDCCKMPKGYVGTNNA